MPKPGNRRGNFEAQIIKPELLVLRPKPENPPLPWFWGSTKKPTTGFEAKPGETVATSIEAKLEKIVATGFEAKPVKIVAAGFEAKPLETVATSFDAKPVKTVRLVLRPNHSQTVDLAFEAQPRNPRSLSPHARCRPDTAPPDLSTARPPSTRPVCSSPVLCIRSPTPTTVLVVARHAAPATCTPRNKQTWFSKWNKGKQKNKTKLSRIQIQTSPSQWLITIKPRNWPLGFSLGYLIKRLVLPSWTSKTPSPSFPENLTQAHEKSHQRWYHPRKSEQEKVIAMF
jgi:hypothetical protein